MSRRTPVVSSLVAVVALLTLSSAALAQVPAHPSGVVNAAAPGGVVEAALFYMLAAMTTVSALGVCIAKNIVRMAVWLFMALSAVAMLYFLLAASFLGAIQLIVYAGGTLVLLIFGVMLTSKSPCVKWNCSAMELAGAGCVTLFSCLCILLTGAVWRSGVTQVVPGAAVVDIGRRLLTTFVVPFEVAGVLLMIVMVGAAHLARQER
jgi:NADH-quinone oxidoreductase subunit J